MILIDSELILTPESMRESTSEAKSESVPQNRFDFPNIAFIAKCINTIKFPMLQKSKAKKNFGR
jgi:hypothetical protein